MIGKRTILVLTIVALLVALAQETHLAFLSVDATHFVWGLVGGLVIGTVVAWLAGGRNVP